MRKILLVDDNQDILDIYQMTFEAEDFEVETAIDGFLGIEKAWSFKPDLMLLDIMMPECNGYEVLKTLRRDAKAECLIIICSNLSQRKDIGKAFNEGADGYIEKADHTPDEVVKRVITAIHDKKFVEKEKEEVDEGENWL